MNIHIAAPDIHAGDAVGNHCLALALDFAEQGHSCELFAQRATSPEQTVRPLADLLSGAAPHTSQDLLLVSHSIYDRHLRALLKLPGRKMAYFHGITPPELLLEHDPVAAYYCARGYAQLPLLAQFDHVVANSAFNLRDLQQQIPGGLAPERTTVVPPISARFPLFAQAPRAPRAMPADGQPLRLLSVGRVVPHKRIEELIEVVALLASWPTCTWWAVATTPHTAHCCKTPSPNIACKTKYICRACSAQKTLPITTKLRTCCWWPASTKAFVCRCSRPCTWACP